MRPKIISFIILLLLDASSQAAVSLSCKLDLSSVWVQYLPTSTYMSLGWVGIELDITDEKTANGSLLYHAPDDSEIQTHLICRASNFDWFICETVPITLWDKKNVLLGPEKLFLHVSRYQPGILSLNSPLLPWALETGYPGIESDCQTSESFSR